MMIYRRLISGQLGKKKKYQTRRENSPWTRI